MQERADFTNGEILRPLLRFTLPILLALFLQAMYGAVDLAVVGWFGTAADVSAVSTGSQILQSVTLVVVALAVGTTVLLGQKLGEKKEAEAGRVIVNRISMRTGSWMGWPSWVRASRARSAIAARHGSRSSRFDAIRM